MKRICFFLSFVFLLLVSGVAEAGDFDGSRPLLFAVFDVIECVQGGACDEVPPESIRLPRFLWINFSEKVIKNNREGKGGRSSTIEHIGHVGGNLILQGSDEGIEGVREGLGWTLAISEDTGKAVLTASGEDVGFVVFGACTFQ